MGGDRPSPGPGRFVGPPGPDDVEALALDALATIPPELRRIIGDVLVTVVDFPDDETVALMDLDSPFDLLGLYSGVDLVRRSVSDPPSAPDRIYLYRRPILDYWCETGEELAHLVRHVLVHEIGHHFGLSDADMECIEREA